MKHGPLAATALGLGLLAMLGQARAAEADDITVLCSNGLKAVVEDLVPKFERETKHHVAVKCSSNASRLVRHSMSRSSRP